MANLSSPQDYSFYNKKEQTLVKHPSSINGQVFYLQNLENCRVYLLDYSSTVYVDNVKDCRLFIGPVSGSCFIRNCSGCVLSAACSQFRCRDSFDMIFYLFTSSDPHIERSKGLKFAPYNFSYPEQTSHFIDAGLNPKNNHWASVYNLSLGDAHHFELLAPKDFSE